LKAEKKSTLSGEVAFRLYDTYGFPLDLTEDILRADNIDVDQKSFTELMEAQRSRGREAREAVTMESKIQLDGQVRFIGYDRLDGRSSVIGIFGNSGSKHEALQGEEIEIVTAETPFYGESGGQVGDRGIITTARGDVVEIVDTQHPTPQLTSHRGRVKKGRISSRRPGGAQRRCQTSPQNNA
jgi:alanyl-tRNA synthetase